MRFAAPLLIALVAAPVTAQEATVVAMTPERVAEAIAFGAGVKKPVVTYAKSATTDPVTIHISTPFARVASIASRAARRYETVRPEEIPASALAPVVSVIVPPAVFRYPPVARSIEQVVVKRTTGEIVRPTEVRTLEPSVYGNAFGATSEAQGLEAIFPADVLVAGNEIRVLILEGREATVTLDQRLIRQIR